MISSDNMKKESMTDPFGIYAITPPPTDPQTTMQRADDVNTVQRMMNDSHTSCVVLIGNAGAGKSTLAALLYRRLQLAKQQGMAAPRHLVWLTINSYTTLTDLIAAILEGVGVSEPGLFLLKPEQQISTLLRALRRSQEPALVVLDQFESMLHPEISQGVAGRGNLTPFLGLLKTDIGSSRILLTSYQSPVEESSEQESRVRSYLVTRISLPEGVALLQQRGVQCAPEELSLIWQRCTGHAYSLVLFSALIKTSTIPISKLLNDPTYQKLWGGDVVNNLLTGIYHYLTTSQRAILQTLSLFSESVSARGIATAIAGNATDRQFLATCEQEVQRFMQLGLIQPVFHSSGELRYAVHNLLRQFMLERFADDGQHHFQRPLSSSMAGDIIPPKNADAHQTAIATAHAQIAQYYRQIIREKCPPRGQRVSVNEVIPIIQAIRHLCLSWRWQRACDMLFEEGLHESLINWGRWNALLGLYTAMLPPLGFLLRKDEGLVASHVGMLYGRMGEYQQSKSYFEQALAAQRQIYDITGEALTLINQGELLRIQGELGIARQNFERAQALLDQKPDDTLQCVLGHNLGLIAQQEQQYDQALYYYTEALQLASMLSQQYYTGIILTNMGMLLYENGEHKEALAVLLAALNAREQLQDPGVLTLERFLVALEQKMGAEAYMALCNEAMEIQPLVFSRFSAS